MDSERDPSISSLITLCIREFHTLLDSVPDEQDETRLKGLDDLGRLRVWIGNFGAHRKQTDRLSLDYRLRETPDLHREVRNHIDDITEAIQGAVSLLSVREKSTQIEETSPASESDDSGSDDSDSDEFWNQVKAENDGHSKLDEYMHDIQYTITSLYKFSLTLQNPAHRDRTAQASRIDLSHFEFYDIGHVSEKFGLPRDSILAQRLGKANTKRRQLLAYHKDHTEKISRYVDVAERKAIETPVDPANLGQTSKGAPSISTKWTQDTTVSTINCQDFDVASESGRTKFSASTSTAGDQAHALMPPPPPPPDVLENMDEDWKYHVYSDLRPYICTFGNCVKANQLYDSYTEWTSFWKHLEKTHPEAFTEDQRQAVVELAEQSTSSAQQCPLCTKAPISNLSRFQQHLARHLQQLSLFVLPRPGPEENEHAARDRESNESQQALIIDDEARGPLKSTSTTQNPWRIEEGRTLSEGPSSDGRLEIIETNRLGSRTTAWRIEEGRTLSEGSSSDDRLETNETNHLGFQEQVATARQELEANDSTLGPENSTTLESMADIALTYPDQGRIEEAEILQLQVIERRKTIYGVEHPETLISMEDLALTYRSQGRWEEAERLQLQVGRWKEAKRLQLQVVETRKEKLGEDHPTTLRSMASLALAYRRQGRLEEAEILQLQVIERRKTIYGVEHPGTLISMGDLALTYRSQGRWEEAERLQLQVVETRKEKLGEDHPATLISMEDLALTYRSQGRWEEAERLQLQVVETRKEKLGEDHLATLESTDNLASIYRGQGRWKEAKRLQLQVVETRKTKFGEDYLSTQ
ncbi:uncharacterized protein N7482_008571 [Penicillium canariense]|uniref:Uncharacterized protein n=1 Tax=Penicillium canariense TaxID=189055 RepID=A0A9W9HU10_9EURO|nr:uncharacterized protein N7482_008571 [Penicillium canariense]KAJ5157471.1 hypothetical protein N7482_008571 [Penicillium canariense]